MSFKCLQMHVNILQFHVMQGEPERTGITTQKLVKMQSIVMLYMLLCNDEERKKSADYFN